MNSGLLNIDHIIAGRTFKRIARRVELVPSTTSTNDCIWAAAKDDPVDGHVVFAEHQTAGRGRMGRSWHSPSGASVMFSVLLIDRDETPTPSAESLGLIAGIAAASAVIETTGLSARIDWPNDIVVGHRKLGGILIESRTLAAGRRAYALGMGINCLQHRNHFPEDIRSRATSIDLESTRPVHRESMATALLVSLDAWLSDATKWDAATLKSAFLELATPLGRDIKLRYEGNIYSGQVIDVDPSAALVVQLHDGTRRLFPAAATSIVDRSEPPSTGGG